MSAKGDEHIIEAIGRCRIIVRDGKVVEIGRPIISSCPLAKRFGRPVEKFQADQIRANIEHRIQSFGMCTPGRRVTETRDFVGFGASELISSGIRSGLLDCAVIVCDGAGTVLAPTPELVQGIGGLMSGLVATSPIPEVIDRIVANGGIVQDKKSASIDQQGGTALAYRQGYARIAVTVASPEDAAAIRETYPDALIFGVHLSGLTRTDAGKMIESADLVASCASEHIRRLAGTRALIQAGTSIPVFALSGRGKELILNKLRSSDGPFLVKGTKLPYQGDTQPEPLI